MKADIITVIDKKLKSRHWGCLASGKSNMNKPRFYIFDYRGISVVTGIVRYYYKKDSNHIFYRGQDKDWEIKPSFYRKINNKSELNKANVWYEKTLSLLEENFDPKGTYEERQALAQHYGMHTKYLDVVDNIQSSLWFAYDNVSLANDCYDSSVGYIEIICIDEKKFNIIDLRNKPSKWMRPHVQQAYCIKSNNPDTKLGSLQDNLVLTMIIPKELLRIWSNYDNMPRYYMYPEESHDDGLAFWRRAVEKLEKNGIDVNNW